MKNNEIFKLIKIFKKYSNSLGFKIIEYLFDYNDKLIKINMLLFYQKFPGNKFFIQNKDFR